MLHIDIKKNS